MLSDVIRFVQSQIDGVIFTRDYFDFNVMAVVAMVCCEMFFLPTSCRWSSVLLFDHVGIVSCFRCNIRHKLCT